MPTGITQSPPLPTRSFKKKKAGSYLKNNHNYELFLSTGKRDAHQESEPVEEKKRGEQEPNRSPCKTRGIVVIKRFRHMKETIALPLCFPSHKRAHTPSFGSSKQVHHQSLGILPSGKNLKFCNSYGKSVKTTRPLPPSLPPLESLTLRPSS